MLSRAEGVISRRLQYIPSLSRPGVGAVSGGTRLCFRTDTASRDVTGTVKRFLKSQLMMIRESRKEIRITPTMFSGLAVNASERRPLFSEKLSENETEQAVKNILSSPTWDSSFKSYAMLFGASFVTTPLESWRGENECESMAGYTRTLLNVIGVTSGVARFMETRHLSHSDVACRRHAWIAIKRVGEKELKDPVIVDPTIWQFIDRREVPEESKFGAFYVGKQSEYFALLKPIIDIKESDCTEGFDPQFDFFNKSKRPQGVRALRVPLFGWDFSSEHLKRGVDVLAHVEQANWKQIAFPTTSQD